jgi:TolB-like protein/Tfp pilus assembly protein PilF
MSLYQELNRRNVFRVAAAYAVAAWLLVQIAETIFPLFGYGDAPARIVVIVLGIGFLPAIIFAWVFEITPEGLKREADIERDQGVTPAAGKKLDRITMAVLAVALAYFAFDKFVLDPQRDIDMAESAARAGAEQAREEARLDMFSDKSIAVLPFVNRSAKEEDEYFTDGMHDELLTRLSRISALKVISRTSMMRYRETEKSIPEIGKELSVATVLEGGVQRSGNQVRINVQLIDSRTDEHLWAEIYDRELTAENLFAIQSEISTIIAQSLEATLSPAERARVYELPTSSLDAYNRYLRGRQSMALRTRESLQQALSEFEKAAEIDPDFALAWVGVADSVHLLFEIGAYDWAEHEERHAAAAEKALALNDQLGEAYTSMAFVYSERGEFEKKMAAFEKAIELNPNYAQAYLWYANELPMEDREEKRLPLLYKAAQLDPRSSLIQINIAGQLMELERDDEARDVVDRLIVTDQGFVPSYLISAGIEARSGRFASAIGHLRKASELDPGNGRALLNLAMGYLALGELEDASGVLQEMKETVGRTSPYYAQLDFNHRLAQGDYESAVSVLDELPEELQTHPASLRGYVMANLFSEDYQSARDYALQLMPFFADPETWQQEITEKQRTECEHAGALHEAGDESGRQLLQLFIQNYEARLSNNESISNMSPSMKFCYLLEGSYDKALDILDGEVASGRVLNWWWLDSKLPWWTLLEDNSRYRELVSRIDSLLDQQRNLLN